MSQLPIFLIVIPLLTAFGINIMGRRTPTICLPLTVAALGGALVAAVVACARLVTTQTTIHYRLGNWAPPLGIEYVIDWLNSLVIIVILVVALFTALSSRYTTARGEHEKIPHYYSLYLLLVVGLVGITLTADAFNLYVLLEITSLTSYALLASGRGRAYYDTFRYVIVGTVGACFYLLGVGYLYMKTGTLNMAELRELLPPLSGSPAVRVAFVLIMVGIWAKMAFFPLHGWLPGAYTSADSTTSCLVAPLMTKVSVYMMLRLMFSVFSTDYIFTVLQWQTVVVWMAVAAIVYGSLSALAQTDIKRMLTYIIVAEIGYMVGGAWLANRNGFTGAVFHIVSDALMTLCLFLAVACMSYTGVGRRLTDLTGVYRRMPLTMAGFTVGAMSMIGIPPTCGFFSKWYLLSGAIDAQQWGYMAALIFSSLVNVVLFFRIIEIGFLEPFQHHSHGDNNGTSHHGNHDEPLQVKEAPLSMLVPLLLTAISLIFLGLLAGDVVVNIIENAIPATLTT